MTLDYIGNTPTYLEIQSTRNLKFMGKSEKLKTDLALLGEIDSSKFKYDDKIGSFTNMVYKFSLTGIEDYLINYLETDLLECTFNEDEFEKYYFKKGEPRFEVKNQFHFNRYYNKWFKLYIESYKSNAENIFKIKINNSNFDVKIAKKEFIKLEIGLVGNKKIDKNRILKIFNKVYLRDYPLLSSFPLKIVVMSGILDLLKTEIYMLNKYVEWLHYKYIEPDDLDEIEKVNDDFKDKPWFKVGVYFATGEIEILIEKNKTIERPLSFPEMAKLLGNSGYEKYILATTNNYKNNPKNIYSNAKKILKIYEHCVENKLQMTDEFIKKYRMLNPLE